LHTNGSPDTVFLTGASGFVGAHVLRELLSAGFHVRALDRSGVMLSSSKHDTDETLGQAQGDNRLTTIQGDLTNVGAFARSLDGCRYVVHCAALYSFAPSDRALTHKVNVIGTASLMEAARAYGVERVVLTSSSATLGPSDGARSRNENDWATEGRASGYHHSKLDQERAAFAGRVPVVALLPTAPVGPRDWKPTPTGQMIVEFARGKMVVKPPLGGLNVVPVEDVARAHVAALTRGRSGERYILGGENLMLDDVWSMLAEITGKPMPRYRIPFGVALAAAYVDEARCRFRKTRRPAVPIEGVRLSRERMFADNAKAKRELGFSPGTARDAFTRAVQWYRDHGYLSS
jgi:dihydroflavonol-4-reductase